MQNNFGVDEVDVRVGALGGGLEDGGKEFEDLAAKLLAVAQAFFLPEVVRVYSLRFARCLRLQRKQEHAVGVEDHLGEGSREHRIGCEFSDDCLRRAVHLYNHGRRVLGHELGALQHRIADGFGNLAEGRNSLNDEPRFESRGLANAAGKEGRPLPNDLLEAAFHVLHLPSPGR